MTASFPTLLERFFTDRLMRQRRASPNTIASYRDAFRLLLRFAQKSLKKAPSDLQLEDLEATFITRFLDHLDVRSAEVELRIAFGATRREALAAPLRDAVRTGMILTRGDLARASREMDVGLRAGERAYILKGFLSQDPAATRAHRG